MKTKASLHIFQLNTSQTGSRSEIVEPTKPQTSVGGGGLGRIISTVTFFRHPKFKIIVNKSLTFAAGHDPFFWQQLQLRQWTTAVSPNPVVSSLLSHVAGRCDNKPQMLAKHLVVNRRGVRKAGLLIYTARYPICRHTHTILRKTMV